MNKNTNIFGLTKNGLIGIQLWLFRPILENTNTNRNIIIVKNKINIDMFIDIKSIQACKLYNL